MQLKNVVLPAPFGPMILAIEPRGMLKSRLSTATRPPKRLVMPRAERMLSAIVVFSTNHQPPQHWFQNLAQAWVVVRHRRCAFRGAKPPKATNLLAAPAS